jgi:rRNA maturation RNase YbeY
MIAFHALDPGYKITSKNALKAWIEQVVEKEEAEIGQLNFILCSDEYLRELNNKYLQHNYYTDVLTFEMDDNGERITGDIFISIDRIKENSKKFEESVWKELKRVMLHGVLHLLGYNDKTLIEKRRMTEREELYLEDSP